MNINLDESRVLNILKALRNELINSKLYYKNHTKEEERIGITSPEEWADTYNDILKTAHENGILTMLELIE